MSPADYAAMYDLMLEGELALSARGSSEVHGAAAALMRDLALILPDDERANLVKGVIDQRDDLRTRVVQVIAPDVPRLVPAKAAL